MQLALITDQHFGARSDSPVFHDFMDRFYSNVFFPYLQEHGIKQVIDLGDTFDRRKYINFFSLHRCKEYYFDRFEELGITLDTIVGNHCIPYKNTLSINACDLLLEYYKSKGVINVINGPQVRRYDGLDIAFVPWICEDNEAETFKMLAETRAQICFGHLELSGFEMYKGSPQNHGIDTAPFSKFDIVCSGHFHHKSTKGNIHYLGCPYEMTWSDYNDPKGFHIFDTATRELTFIPNPYTIFHKISYDDTIVTLDDLVKADYSFLKDAYIKVIVKNKTNPYWFDLFIEALEKAGASDVKPIEDSLSLELENEDEIIDEAEDTRTILSSYVDSVVEEAKKDPLKSLMDSLYSEAISLSTE
jgi:hypothetical protein